MMTVDVIEDPAIMRSVPWAEYSERELALAGDGADILWNKSFIRWVAKSDGHVAALAGIFRETLIGQPTLWFLLARDIRFKDLHAARRAVQYLMGVRFPGTITAVADEFTAGVRFAKFCGLSSTGQRVALDDKTYTYYGVL